MCLVAERESSILCIADSISLSSYPYCVRGEGGGGGHSIIVKSFPFNLSRVDDCFCRFLV